MSSNHASRQLTTTANSPGLPKPAETTPLKSWDLRTPTQRDLQIYKMVKIQRAEQWAVAMKFNLHESRVSQIIKKIHRWIAAGGDPADPQLRDHVARQRVSRATQRLRLLRAIEVATYAVETDARPLKTVRRRYHGTTEVWHEETTHPQPEANLSAVRLLLKATQALQEFDQQDELDNPPSLPTCNLSATSSRVPNLESPAPSATDHDLLPAIFDLLCAWCLQAQTNGHRKPAHNVPALVASTLDNLLGTTLTQTVSEEPSPTAVNKIAMPVGRAVIFCK